jgi:hypothetical protein
MLSIFLIGAIVLSGMFYFLRAKKQMPYASAVPLETNIKCPSCKVPLQIEGMLDTAVFFGPGTIVFDCSHCHDRVYFSPYEDHIETGTLGCSPVVDAIPYEKFSYPPSFDMASNTQDGWNFECSNQRTVLGNTEVWAVE